MAREVRTKLVSPGRRPLVEALAAVRAATTGRFADIEPIYLGAMQEFDRLVASGEASQGDIQNGKGDFFNDVLALLLEACSGKALHTRPNVPGLSFPNHKLDVAYPATGQVRFTIETKATGVPKHPRNPKQPHLGGRAGSADLEKRIKEAIFKNIDLKAEAARYIGRGGGPTSDLQSFLRSAPPRSYIFLSARVRDAGDHRQAIKFAQIAGVWFDGCGLYCYGWNDVGAAYESKSVPPPLDLDRVLATVCTALRTME